MEDVLVIQTDGTKLVAVQRMDLDLTEKQAQEMAVADNRAAQVSLDWDIDVLKELDIDLAKFWSPEELESIFGFETELLTDEDDVPELPEEPVSKLGDLYTLGAHRLLCGDSTSIDAVERLMDGQKAVCMWTDPPYGVDYTGKTKKALKIENDGSIGLRELLDGAFRCASIVLEGGAAVYVAHPAGVLNVTFGNAFVESGWKLHQTLIWDKGTIVLGHSDYHFAHEPIFYGHTPAQGRHGRGGKGWYGGDAERSILTYPKPSRNESHPTMKPVALIEHCLKNVTQRGTLTFDPFGGSGSTLIACEKTNRRCYMMELDPRYCDVIVARWEAATGKKAVLNGATTQGD